jgi:maltose/maltodextrin transport system permease protein
MDVIKKKHWWQSDALKWSVMGLLCCWWVTLLF